MADETKPVEPQATARKIGKDEVEVRVLKHGHDKVHTGTQTQGVDDKHKHGDKLIVHKTVAAALEGRGYVETI